MKNLLIVCLLAVAPAAHAINKCTDADGKTTYTNEACPEKATGRGLQIGSTKKLKRGEVVGYGPLLDAYVKTSSAVDEGDGPAYFNSLSSRARLIDGEDGRFTLESMRHSGLKARSDRSIPVGVNLVDELVATTGEEGFLTIRATDDVRILDPARGPYWLIKFVNEKGVWKFDETIATAESFDRVKAAIRRLQLNSCIYAVGKPESLPNGGAMRLLPSEKQVDKFALEPNEKKALSFPAVKEQIIAFRAAHNQALACKYMPKYPNDSLNYPTGISTDAGKTWTDDFDSIMRVKPVNGAINLLVKNAGQETMNIIVATGKGNSPCLESSPKVRHSKAGDCEGM
jgi:Domain of unknown function (DUF4124)